MVDCAGDPRSGELLSAKGSIDSAILQQRLMLQHAIQERTRWLHACSIHPFRIDRYSEQSECLRVTFEAAVDLHQCVHLLLARVDERWVNQVVGQADRLHKIWIDVEIVREQPPIVAAHKPLADRTPDLGHLQGVC